MAPLLTLTRHGAPSLLPKLLIVHGLFGSARNWGAIAKRMSEDREVVADIAPVAYRHSQSHLIAAMRGLDLHALSSRSVADARLAQAVDDPQVRAFLLQSLDLKATPPRWRLNLDVLDAQMPLITGWPDTTGLAPFAGPVLFLSGARSDYVRPEARPLIRALFPAARMAKLPDTGHWLHAENPRDFEATLRVFLD